MTTGTKGSQTVFDSTYTTPPNPGASPAPVPVGKRRYKSWSGTDSPNSGFTVLTIKKPAQYAVVERRRKDGSTYQKEIVVKAAYYVKKKIRTGFRQPNNYTVFATGANRNCGRIYYGRKPCVPSGTWQLIVDPYIPSMPSSSSIFTANDDIKLLTKMQQRVNDSDFDPAVFLGTINQTLGLIADRAKRIAKSVAYMKKGNMAKAWQEVYGHKPGRTSVRKSTAQNVLEIQYGWRPLLNDVYEGAVWVAALANKPRMTRVSQRLQRSGAVDLLWAARHAFRTYEILVQKQIVAYLKEEKQDVSLNAYSPALLAWELLPWSFVVDWFIPVGDFLQARGVASQLKGTFVSTTRYNRTLEGNHYSELKTCYEEITSVYDFLGIKPYWNEFQMTRSVSTTLNVEPPVLKPLSKAASWEHCLNAIALVTALRSDKPDATLRKAGRLSG